MFVSQASIDAGIVQSYGLKKQIMPVKNCRTIGKKDMKFNDTMPKMKVDPESYVSASNNLYYRKVTLANLYPQRPSKQTTCSATQNQPPNFL
jgi:urease alpha subunit